MEKVYPEPQAFHNDVFNDSKRFWETFESFQSHMEMNPNTINSFKKNVPATADGKEADMQLFLHILYKQVTGSGGYENVESRKKWNEVSSVFNFVPTEKTDPTVFLRYLYKSLLYQYEQTYFFRREGPLRSPPTPGMHAAGNGTTQQVAPKRTRSLVSDSVTYTYPAGTEFSGKVKWVKLDHGHHVTVAVGTKLYTGDMYLRSPVDEHGNVIPH